MDLSLIYEDHFHAKGYSPHGVNRGFCFIWALLAHRELRGQAELVSVVYVNAAGKVGENKHAALRLGDAYYDSESPRGVSAVGDLCFSTREMETAGHSAFSCVQSKDIFCEWWTAGEVYFDKLKLGRWSI